MKGHVTITRKIRDPLFLYTTFQKIFTIIRIFLKSEAPKAPGLFTFVHRGGLEKKGRDVVGPAYVGLYGVRCFKCVFLYTSSLKPE